MYTTPTQMVHLIRTLQSPANGANGVATIDATSGDWSYTPSYKLQWNRYIYGNITDDDNNVETQDITVTVNNVNDAATFAGNLTGSGNEDGGAIAGTLTASDSADGLSNANFTVSANGANGVATIDATSGGGVIHQIQTSMEQIHHLR